MVDSYKSHAPQTKMSDLDREAVDDLDQEAEVLPVTYSITSYGADYPVDGLVKRLQSGDIFVPTFYWEPEGNTEVVGFQREYVWPRPKADKFVESLLLGLPVPGVFLVKEPSGRLLVLDGHQRLHTLRAFYEGVIEGLEYRLKYVQDRYVGKTYKELEIEERRRLDDSIIHATVIRQDEPSEDQSSIYVIFERLNTGGMNLQPQEIRVALYHGEFSHLLTELNVNPSWRELYGKKSKRLKDLEMILRFFSLYYHVDDYKRPMKEFLNKYMGSNRSLQRQSKETLSELFNQVVTVVRAAIGPRAFRPFVAVNAAAVDSIMVGVARRLEQGDISDKKAMQRAYKDLLKLPEYLSAIQSGTAEETSVRRRLELTTNAFAELP